MFSFWWLCTLAPPEICPWTPLRHFSTIKATYSVIESFDLVQSVTGPTQKNGNTLDLIITRPDGKPTWCTADPPGILSDHSLIVSEFSTIPFAVHRVERTTRPWRKVDRAAVKCSIMSSPLVSDMKTLNNKTVEELFDIYDGTLRRIADKYAPETTSSHRVRRLSPWFDDECRCMRRRTRLLERRYRRSFDDKDRTDWVAQMRSMHSLYEQKESLYWTTCIASNTGNPQKLWNSVSSILRKNKDLSAQPSPS